MADLLGSIGKMGMGVLGHLLPHPGVKNVLNPMQFGDPNAGGLPMPDGQQGTPQPPGLG